MNHRIVRSVAAIALGGALLTAGSAAALATTVYAGGTNQHDVSHPKVGLGIDVYVARGRVAEVEYYANYTGDSPLCAARFDGSLTVIHPNALIHRGVFHAPATANGSPTDLVRGLQGRFRGGSVSGSFSEQFSTLDPATHHDIHCTSGKVTFTARRS